MTKYVSGVGCQVSGGEKRQGTGAVQDALRGRGDLRQTGETHEILNSIPPNGRDTGNTGNTGFFEHTSLSRRLSNPSRQTREIEAHRHKAGYIVNQSCLESCYISKGSCIIVLYRVNNKESFFWHRVLLQISPKTSGQSFGRPAQKPPARRGCYTKSDQFKPIQTTFEHSR